MTGAHPTQRPYEIINYFCRNTSCCHMKYNDQIVSQVYTCHGSWAVMTCANLWPDWMIRTKMRAKRIIWRFHSWARKAFLKWESQNLPRSPCHQLHLSLPRTPRSVSHMPTPNAEFPRRHSYLLPIRHHKYYWQSHIISDTDTDNYMMITLWFVMMQFAWHLW